MYAGSGHFRPRETAGRRDKKRTPYLQQPAGTLSQVWTFGSKEKDLRSRLIRTRHVGNLEDRFLLTSGPYRSARQSSGSDLSEHGPLPTIRAPSALLKKSRGRDNRASILARNRDPIAYERARIKISAATTTVARTAKYPDPKWNCSATNFFATGFLGRLGENGVTRGR